MRLSASHAKLATTSGETVTVLGYPTRSLTLGPKRLLRDTTTGIYILLMKVFTAEFAAAQLR